ncbi:NAD-dependent epimerase/dehydratase family protein [Bradyrhizobium sp. 2TAF24]|uniref:NAD-dependent epimerase/dehydratase family protein n=1 Tax=Bradyrhizobium sp. 2TAF24 TaxID=3233011 RepID=UPI003F91D46B
MRILLTGAAGGVGARLRKLLPAIYPDLVLSDLRRPDDLSASETFVTADLADLDQVKKAVAGIDGIIHLGGFSVEGPWETILNANIIGTYNLFEAARLAGVKRVVFASSNHAMGFHPRGETIGTEAIIRPDTRYGVSKAFGEALGAFYAFKHDIGVLSIRIGNVGEEPLDERRLAIWLKTEDLVSLIRIGLERAGLIYEVVYGMSDNKRAWWDNARALELGYRPTGRSEDYAAGILAAQQPKNDPVGDFFQGGPFCTDEFAGDLSKIKQA